MITDVDNLNNAYFMRCLESDVCFAKLNTNSLIHMGRTQFVIIRMCFSILLYEKQEMEIGNGNNNKPLLN